MTLQMLDETYKAFGLRFQAAQQFGIGQPTLRIEQAVDLRQENPFGKNVGVAITENVLQLLNRA